MKDAPLAIPRIGFFLFCSLAVASPLYGAESLRVLFLGDNGHHQPRVRYEIAAPVLATRGIDLAYTDQMPEITAERLAQFDAILLYANIEAIEARQAEAILSYVADGGGYVPIHCASFCFQNSPEMIALLGGQFQRHEWASFRTQIALADHPIMRGFEGFESEDETYVHDKHNEQNRTVLTYRVEGDQREPWTWVRTHGDGRVFYTAWGHDHRTWGNAGFLNLLERGIRWASGGDPAAVPAYQADRTFEPAKMTSRPETPPEFDYLDVGPQIPNYPPSNRWGVQEEPHTQMQKPLPAADSMQHFVTPERFTVELFADEDDGLTKPLAMNWDELGRLWVCVSVDYPNNLQPQGEGNDRIVVLEDTDGDGRADMSTQFAEGLSIPTAIVPFRGGVIVQDGVETVFFKDTNGDGKADLRKLLISGWALGDTHGGVSNFRYGLDNWIWAMQGYNNSRPVLHGRDGATQETQGFRMGFFRFRLDDGDPPVVTDIEFIRSTNNNTWGLGISEEGLIFGSTANRVPSVFMPIANRYYEAVRGWTPSLTLDSIADDHLFNPVIEEGKVRQVDHHGGYTAGAGHALYTARRYPKTWWNRTAFVCGPTGKLVGTYVLQPQGAGFRSQSPINLVASYDEWSAPIMAEVGPDGNVWFIDWYNYIVQHNPTPRGFETGQGNAYETELRDKKHGRVYRVAYNQSGSTEQPDLSKATTVELVDLLQHDNMLWRLQAQRLLVDRQDPNAIASLLELVSDESSDEIGLNVAANHALWTLHGLGAFEGSTSDALSVGLEALNHASAGVRRNAIAVLPRTLEVFEAMQAAKLLRDRDAQVRLAAFLALAEMPRSEEIGRAITEAGSYPLNANDKWIGDAMTCAAARHAVSYLREIAQGEAISPELVQRAQIVAEHHARSGGEQTAQILSELPDAPLPLAEAIVRGWQEGWPDDAAGGMSEAEREHVVRLMEKLPAESQTALIELAGSWNLAGLEEYRNSIVAKLVDQLFDESQADDERLAVAKRLVELQPKSGEVVTQLLDLISPRLDPGLAADLLTAIGQSQTDDLASLVLSRLETLSPSLKESALRMLLRDDASAEAVVAAMERGELDPSLLTLEMRQLLTTGRKESLASRADQLLEKAGGLPSADRQAVIEELLPVTQMTGDVNNGREMFKKHCSQCHRHGDLGADIGPNLTGMAVHPKAELLEQILDPSRSVEGNYRMYVVTVAGSTVQGLVAGESRTALELIDTEGKTHSILREDIDEDGFFASQKSLMPEGFEKQMSETELADLLEFLTSRGQYVPLSLRKVATIATDRGMFYSRDANAERLVFADWGTKEFQGVPFQLTDPADGRVANAIMLQSRNGAVSERMPRSVSLSVNLPAAKIHLLSGVSGWGWPASERNTVSMIVRLHYADGNQEDHELINGIHLSDYIRRTDVDGSQFAFDLNGRQLRYLVIAPERTTEIESIELLKGADRTAPIVMAVTLESP